MKAFRTATILILFAQGTAAQHAHNPPEQSAPSQSGQAGFAALAEVVTHLRRDPNTDWSRVNLNGLRQHLADMDALALDVAVSAIDIPNGAKFTISPESNGAEAAWRMVPMHAPVLEAETGWNSTVQITTGQLIWTVTHAKDAAQIRGLGFFGLMATGNHHPVHHLSLARGQGMH